MDDILRAARSRKTMLTAEATLSSVVNNKHEASAASNQAYAINVDSKKNAGPVATFTGDTYAAVPSPLSPLW